MRKLIHRFIPSNFTNVAGLTRRLLFEGKAAGRAAMLYSIGGLLLSPLDILLKPFEKRLYRKAGKSALPQIFVCGPPRSGTTVTAQILIKFLPVNYLDNLTSLFPRSPIMAQKLFGWIRRGRQRDIPLDSFYGRTTRLSYPNDALYIWDRWTGSDRKQIPDNFNDLTKKEIAQFFSALEVYSDRPVLNKNNSLNTYAHLVAEALPQAYFICLDRDPVFLAQSHLVARRFIHGNEHVPYGIRGDMKQVENPIDDICRQVIFHNQCMHRQQEIIGKDRFIILPYEDFCRRPAYWVQQFSGQILGQKVNYEELERELMPLQVANKIKVDNHTFKQIENTLAELMDHKYTQYADE